MTHHKAALVMVLLAICLAGCEPPPVPDHFIGYDAPDVTVVAATKGGGGKTAMLSDFRGKVVLLDFWATWCQPCRELMPTIDDLCKKHPKDLQVVAVSNETMMQITGFHEASGVSYPMFQDPAGEAWQKYEIKYIPVSVVIDRSGKVVYHEMGAYPDKLIAAVETALAAGK